MQSPQSTGDSYGAIADKILMPLSHYKEIISALNNVLASRLGKDIDHASIDILDFGCGQGFLLKHLSDSGYVTYGYDISDKLRSISTSNSPNSKIFDSLETIHQKFDVIVLSEVFEHLQDPISVIKRLSALLRKNGILLLTMPNGDRLSLGLHYHKKNHFQPISDIYYTFPEVSSILKICSFRMIYWNSHGPLFPSFKTKNNLIHNIVSKSLLRILEFFYIFLKLDTLKRKTLIVISSYDSSIHLSI